MTIHEKLIKQVQDSEVKINELEQELERKDKIHIFELSLLNGYLQTIMKKYCLD